ncbi:MAG: type II secretion system F family protein [Sphingopyxis sp.]|jgi:tight adherence protein C|uniref:type II secretion system F family protein n=1 Tax=Sphingopyxis sp. TaxID=1908224 RepID=UPI003D6D69C0
MLEYLASSLYLRIAVLMIIFVLVVGTVATLSRFLTGRARVIGRLHEIPEGPVATTTGSLRGSANSSRWAKLTDAIERSGVSLADSKSDALRTRMIAAGYESPAAPKIYTLIRLVMIFALPTAIVLPQFFAAEPPSLLRLYFYGAGLAVLGLVLPSLWLSAKADRRREEVVNGFPDSLDLMLVCVEAGLGLEAALDRVGREMVTSHPLIARMLSQTTLELRAGASREEALRNMAGRTKVDEIRAFATLLIQSDKLGSSIGTTLRVYANEMREKRRMRAEEKAHRLPVLLSIPLVVCMLPVMIGVLMLPAAVRVVREVVPALAGGG